jgi:hypothetical protein
VIRGHAGDCKERFKKVKYSLQPILLGLFPESGHPESLALFSMFLPINGFNEVKPA